VFILHYELAMKFIKT